MAKPAFKEVQSGIWSQWNFINFVTLLRALAIVPIMILWTLEMEDMVFWAVFTAALTDMEGHLSRLRWRWIGVPTEFGARFDPLADKFFVTPLIALAAYSQTDWLIGLLFAVLFAINFGYDMDNVWRRRADLLDGCLGKSPSTERLKVTLVSRCKTFILFMAICWAFATPNVFQWVNRQTLNWVEFGPSGGIALAGVALLMVGWSWFINRREWLFQVLRRG